MLQMNQDKFVSPLFLYVVQYTGQSNQQKQRGSHLNQEHY